MRQRPTSRRTFHSHEVTISSFLDNSKSQNYLGHPDSQLFGVRREKPPNWTAIAYSGYPRYNRTFIPTVIKYLSKIHRKFREESRFTMQFIGTCRAIWQTLYNPGRNLLPEAAEPHQSALEIPFVADQRTQLMGLGLPIATGRPNAVHSLLRSEIWLRLSLCIRTTVDARKSEHKETHKPLCPTTQFFLLLSVFTL